MDGGNLLACDLCERVICTMRCLEIPILFEELEKSSSSYRFVCPTCHNNFYRTNKPLQPYFVCCFTEFP